MKDPIKNSFDCIKLRSESEEFKNKFRLSESDFTRNRKINIFTIVSFVLSCVKTGLPFDLEHFIKDSKLNEFTPAAMTKARNKLSYCAFDDLLSVMQKELPLKKNWKGYRIFAVDGMQGELPRTPELMEKYKRSKTSAYPQFHAVAMYDVLNHFFTEALFEAAPENERQLGISLFKKHNERTGGREKAVYLFDRGFPSVALIRTLERAKAKYVMRVSKSFLKEVNAFRLSEKSDEVLHIYYDKKRAQDAKLEERMDAPFDFSLRCVKVRLNSGETEILMTNLSAEEATVTKLGELYSLRWEIEVSYTHLLDSEKF